MIDLGTLPGLHKHPHELHVYCPRFNRWQALPHAELIAPGYGSRRLPPVRRWNCGEVGQLLVRRPVPTRPAVGGPTEPPW